MTEWLRAWKASLTDYIDLMINPGRRVRLRDQEESVLEFRYQRTIVLESRKRGDPGLFRKVLSGKGHEGDR